MVVFYNDIDEAIKNYEYKKEGGKYFDEVKNKEIDTDLPERHWLLVYYQNTVYYTATSFDPRQNEQLKNELLDNIKKQILHERRINN